MYIHSVVTLAQAIPAATRTRRLPPGVRIHAEYIHVCMYARTETNQIAETIIYKSKPE